MNITINSKYKKISDLMYDRTRKKKEFNCRNCGKKLKQLHSNHLKSCGITKDEYIDRFGFPNEYYEMDAILDAVINKLWSLYVSVTYKWIILSGFTHKYTTKDTQTIKKENCELQVYKKNNVQESHSVKMQIPVLTKMQFKDHFEGRNTLGVFPNISTSKFIVFDIDSYTGVLDARDIAFNIKHFLLLYFNNEEVHISFSGNKGYHVTLYFNKYIDIYKLNVLFNIVLDEINIKNYSDIVVEMRPTMAGIDGSGVKLPLGVNFLNENCNNYAFFTDKYFNPIEDEIEYVLNIKKSDGNIVKDIIADYKSNIIYKGINGNKTINKSSIVFNDITAKDSIKDIINNGLVHKGTRHDWSFLIAMYFKKFGIDKFEAYNRLLEWNYQQLESGMSKSSKIEIDRDVKKIIGGVYNESNNYHLSNSDNKGEYYLSKDDMSNFIVLNNYAKKTGKCMLTSQKVLMALLIHGKKYADNERKFYMTYDQILLMTGLNNNMAIKRALINLEKLNCIEVYKYGLFSPQHCKSNPNYFLVPVNDDTVNNVVKIPDILDELYFYRIMVAYFGYKNLNKVFTRSIINRVKKINF